MKKVVEIIYCGKYKTSNKKAADLAGKNLIAEATYNLKHFSSLEIMASYLKEENPDALGVIAFNKNKKIMSDGINIISDSNLFIVKAFRMWLKHIWGMQHIFSEDYFKDYFFVSSKYSFQPKLNPADMNNWETLLIADNIRTSDIIAIDRISAEKNLPAKFETKKSRLYMTAECPPFYLTDFLAELNQNLIKIKVVGAYKLEEMKGE